MEDPYTNFVQLWNPVGDRCHDNSFTFRIKWFPFRIHLLFTKLSNPGIQVYEINLLILSLERIVKILVTRVTKLLGFLRQCEVSCCVQPCCVRVWSGNPL